MYRINDLVTGEILESKFKYIIFEEAYKRMEEYEEKYHKEFYLDFIGSGVWNLKEYKVEDNNE